MSEARVELTSGVWAGHYQQQGRAFPQKMTLEFADGLVRGDGVDAIGTFTCDGEYRVDRGTLRLGWVKTYDGAHSVLYLGALERGAIVGTWNVDGWKDAFALEPARTMGTMKSEGTTKR